MLEIAIPGAETLRLEALVADFDGTLARDGSLLPGVAAAFARLSESLTLHVVTADTHGGARAALASLPCQLVVLAEGGQDVAKRQYVESLGASRCAARRPGRNDRLMLAAAGLGIAVIEPRVWRWRRCWRRAWRCRELRRRWVCCSIRRGLSPLCVHERRHAIPPIQAKVVRQSSTE